MASSVKGTASKQRIQPVSKTAASVSAVDASAIEASLAVLKRSGLTLQQYLYLQDGDFPSEPSVISLKEFSCWESARSSLTARDSAIASTSHRGKGSGGLILSGRQFPKQSGGLFPQNRSLPFELSMRSPKPPPCSDRAHDYLATIASASTIHHDSRCGGVSPSGHRVPKRSRGLFPLLVLLLSERSKKLGSFHNTPSGNVICPVVGGGVIV